MHPAIANSLAVRLNSLHFPDNYDCDRYTHTSADSYAHETTVRCKYMAIYVGLSMKNSSEKKPKDSLTIVFVKWKIPQRTCGDSLMIFSLLIQIDVI